MLYNYYITTPQRHRVTSRKNWIPSSSAVRTPISHYITQFLRYRTTARWSFVFSICCYSFVVTHWQLFWLDNAVCAYAAESWAGYFRYYQFFVCVCVCRAGLIWLAEALQHIVTLRISVTVRSKAWVSGCSLAGIAGSNPAGVWMFVSGEFCVLLGKVLRDGLMPRPEEFYRVWSVWVWSRNIRNEAV